MKENITKNKSTPVMRQYWEAKRKYPDAIMLFRMGDFYETFDEDAKLTANILNITHVAWIYFQRYYLIHDPQIDFPL